MRTYLRIAAIALLIMSMNDLNDMSVLYGPENPAGRYGRAGIKAREYNELDYKMATGDESEIIEIIDKIKDIDLVIGSENSPLQMAVMCNRYQIAELLIKKGAGVNQATANGNTPLGAAVGNKNFKMAELLLNNGADANKACYGSHPLKIAADRADAKMMKLLIEKGVIYDSVETSLNKGLLHECIISPHIGTEIIETLLESGAKICDDKFYGDNDILKALSMKRYAVVRALIKHGADVFKKDTNDNTILHMSEYFPDEAEGVGIFKNAGLDINARNRSGETPVFMALSSSKNNLLKAFAANGADLDARYRGGSLTLLISAIEYGNQKAAKIIIDAGASVSAAVSSGATPLHIAASRSDMDETIKLLVANRASVNAANSYGETPFFNAMADGTTATVDILARSGANFGVRNRSDQTALLKAISFNKYKTAGYLIKNFPEAIKACGTAEVSAIFIAFCQAGEAEFAEAVLEKGADIDGRDTSGNTALHIAAANSRTGTAAFLIKRGADIEAANKCRETPLMTAAGGADGKTVKLLTASGAKFEKENIYGDRPVHIAAARKNIAAMKELIAIGADINTRNRDGRTPLYIAEDLNNREMVNLLKANGADARIGDKNGVSPLDVSKKKAADEIEKFKKATARAKFASGRGMDIKFGVCFSLQPELHRAAILKRADISGWLADLGADINAKNADGRTPLDIAMEVRSFEVFDELFSRSAELDLNSKYFPDFAGYLLSSSRQDYLIEKILARYPDAINSVVFYADGRNKWYEFTLINYMVMTMNADLLKKFIERGAGVNVMSERDGTPMYYAVNMALTVLENKNREMIGYADRNKVIDKIFEIIDILRGANAVLSCREKRELDSLLIKAFTLGNERLLKMIFESGIGPDTPIDEYFFGEYPERTPLNRAIAANLPGIAEFLITKGAKLEYNNPKIPDPLEFAITRQNYAIAEMILKRSKKTAVTLHEAVSEMKNNMAGKVLLDGTFEVETFASFVKTLKANGCDITAKNDKGRTALDIIEDWDVGMSVSNAGRRFSEKFTGSGRHRELLKIYKTLRTIKNDIAVVLKK